MPRSCLLQRHHIWYQKPNGQTSLIHSAAQGLPQKMPSSAASTVPAGDLLWNGSLAPWSLNLDLSPLPYLVRDLNIFLLCFVNRASQSLFLVSEQWKGLENYLRSRKSYLCQCPHSSAQQMLRTFSPEGSMLRGKHDQVTATLMRGSEPRAIAAWDGGIGSGQYPCSEGFRGYSLKHVAQAKWITQLSLSDSSLFLPE